MADGGDPVVAITVVDETKHGVGRQHGQRDIEGGQHQQAIRHLAARLDLSDHRHHHGGRGRHPDSCGNQAGFQGVAEIMDDEKHGDKSKQGFEQSADQHQRVMAQPAQIDADADFEQQHGEHKVNQQAQTGEFVHADPAEQGRAADEAGQGITGDARQRQEAGEQFPDDNGAQKRERGDGERVDCRRPGGKYL